MRRFHFKLESLLRLRQQQQRVAEIAVAGADAACREIEARMNSCQQDLALAGDSMRDSITQHQSQRMLELAARGAQARQQLEHLETELASAQIALSQARHELAEATRATETLETLKQTEWDAFRSKQQADAWNTQLDRIIHTNS